MTTYLYGMSDDLIELDGDIYDEVYYAGEWTDIIFSNGVHAQIRYEGEWSIRVLSGFYESGVTVYAVGTPESEKYCNYSDVLAVDGAEWAVIGKKVNKR